MSTFVNPEIRMEILITYIELFIQTLTLNDGNTIT